MHYLNPSYGLEAARPCSMREHTEPRKTRGWSAPLACLEAIFDTLFLCHFVCFAESLRVVVSQSFERMLFLYTSDLDVFFLQWHSRHIILCRDRKSVV